MNIYEELQERGLIAQVTDEKEIRELISCHIYQGILIKICTILYLINLFSNVIVCKV